MKKKHRYHPDLFQKFQIGVLLFRVNQGKLRVAVESGDSDSGFVGGGFHGVKVFVRPALKLHELKPVVFRRLKPFQKRKLAVHRLNAGGFLKFHGIALNILPMF